MKQLEHESIIQTHQVLAINTATKELDVRLHATLSLLSLDTEGRLVKPLTSRSFFKVFEPCFSGFLDEWLEYCNVNGRSK